MVGNKVSAKVNADFISLQVPRLSIHLARSPDPQTTINSTPAGDDLTFSTFVLTYIAPSWASKRL